MPFEVTPSKQVVIDWTDTGPDDALHIDTTDPSATYFATMHDDGRYKRMGLVQDAIPADIQLAAREAARELLQSVGSLSQKELEEVEEWLGHQSGHREGLQQVVVERILQQATVRGGATSHDKLNIGTQLAVSFHSVDIPPLRRSAGRLHTHGIWTAEGTIRQITPAKRFAAIMWAAAHY